MRQNRTLAVVIIVFVMVIATVMLLSGQL